MAKNSGDDIVGFMGFIFMVVIGAMAASYFGWISSAALITSLTVMGGLIGLILVVKLPWDLYFDARNLLLEQQESVKKGLKVDEDNIQYAKSTASRALLLSVAIHLFSGLGIGIYSFYSDAGKMGYAFAAAYALSLFLRPIAAFYQHQKIRLAQLRQQCTFPRDDVWELKARVEDSIQQSNILAGQMKEALESIRDLKANSESDRNHNNSELSSLNRKIDDRTEKLGREFEKAIEQLTEDKEVLRGLRSIVKLIKEA